MSEVELEQKPTSYHAPVVNGAQVTNPNFQYANAVERYQGFLSRQFPTTANPAPLGLCGFALTTFVLSMINAGGLVSINAKSNGVVMGLALFYGGLVQLLAGMWEFKTGNTFGTVAFASYGGFWMSFAALNMNCLGFLNGYSTYANGVKDLHDGLGLYLLAWSMFSLFMTLAAHRTTLALMTLLFLVFVTFLMLSIGEFTVLTFPDISIRTHEAGGCFGVMAALLAWYCAYAGLLSKKISLIILPVVELDPIYRSWGWLPADDDKASN